MTEIPSDNLPYLFAAFAVVWVVFFLYAGYMTWRRRSAQQELEELREPGASEDGPAARPADSDEN